MIKILIHTCVKIYIPVIVLDFDFSRFGQLGEYPKAPDNYMFVEGKVTEIEGLEILYIVEEAVV